MRKGHQIQMMRLRKPLAQRLADHKAGPAVVGGYYWTVPELRTSSNGGRGFYQASWGLGCDPEGSTFRLRLEDANAHCSGRLSNITGYFTDEHGEGDTLKPIVARLPRSRGFLAGWTMGEGMAAVVEGRVYDCPTAAAHAAHQIAEQDAEEEAEAAGKLAAFDLDADDFQPIHADAIQWGVTPLTYC